VKGTCDPQFGVHVGAALTGDGLAILETTVGDGANGRQAGGNHYCHGAVQCWDYITSNNIGYLEGNVIKYVSRWKDKGGILDLKKARHYLDKLIELEEAKE
jgi:hypothetical protein